MPPQIPGIEIGSVIGRGGNATVHAGVQTAVGRPVAVKVDDRVVTDERNQRRFVREATSAGLISAHPHVVSLIDAGTTDDHHPYLVMELCEGGSVSDLLKNGPLPLVDALDIAIAVTGALAAAHAAGILHRDVKPANILIDSFGTPRLSDFGLASRHLGGDEIFTATVEALTPAYAPPEAFARVTPTVRSDVWSMGATLYAMLAGGNPRRRPDGTSLSLAELIVALPEPLQPLPGAEALMPVLWRATAYDPEDRHASAGELREDLVRVRSSLGPPSGRVGGPEVTIVTTGAPALPPSPAVAPLPRRRGPVVLLAAGALALGLAAGSFGTWLAVDRSATGVATAGLSSDAGPSGSVPSQSAPASSVGPESGPESAGSGSAGSGTGPGTVAPGAADPGSPASESASGPAEATAAPSPTDQPVADPADGPQVGGCWGGLVSIAGNVSAAPRDCSEPHYWETYAVGQLDPTTTSATGDAVALDPVVQATCSTEALVDHLDAESIDPAAFSLDVVPPSEAEFLVGRRGFACVVSRTGSGEVTGSLAGTGAP